MMIVAVVFFVPGVVAWTPSLGGLPTSSLALQGGRPCARQAPARTNGARLTAHTGDEIQTARRTFLEGAAAAAALVASPKVTVAAALDADRSFSVSWSATDGFDEISPDKSFIAFDDSAYRAMRDDQSRTPLFQEAITRRLSSEACTVLDVGTGPFALLAIMAARAGATKVYACEANPEAAKRAREAVKNAKDVPSGVIEILDGFSTDIDLPGKVDLVLAEICGSVASEEGLVATIRDARKRLVKKPDDPASYIPCEAQTLVAPCTYAQHFQLGPPEFDWSKLGGEPLRLNCRDEQLQILAPPQLAEDIRFYDPVCFAQPSVVTPGSKLRFEVRQEALDFNTGAFLKELQGQGKRRPDDKSREDAQRTFAGEIASTLSGAAFWPRLVLTQGDASPIVVDSRAFPSGGHRKSHWQTVVSVGPPRPLAIKAGDRIELDFKASVTAPTAPMSQADESWVGSRERVGAVASPVRYQLSGSISS